MIKGEAEPLGTGVRCQVLLMQRGRAREGYAVQRHAHPFWQVDLATAMPFRAVAGHAGYDLACGQAIVIPAGIAHGFAYEAGAEYLTLKYRVHGMTGEALPGTAGPDGAAGSLLQALDGLVTRSGTPGPGLQETVAHVLAALMLAQDSRAESDVLAGLDPLVSRIKRTVWDRGGRPVTVADVADQVRYSVSHVSARFREAERMSLKSWIDGERMRVIEPLLAYSDLTISQIADQLAFADVFSFSRFCKRMTGKSPRVLRRQGRR